MPFLNPACTLSPNALAATLASFFKPRLGFIFTPVAIAVQKGAHRYEVGAASKLSLGRQRAPLRLRCGVCGLPFWSRTEDLSAPTRPFLLPSSLGCRRSLFAQPNAHSLGLHRSVSALRPHQLSHKGEPDKEEGVDTHPDRSSPRLGPEVAAPSLPAEPSLPAQTCVPSVSRRKDRKDDEAAIHAGRDQRLQPPASISPQRVGVSKEHAQRVGGNPFNAKE